MIPESELPTRDNQTLTVPSMIGGRVDGASGTGSVVDLSDTRSAIPLRTSLAVSEAVTTDLQFGRTHVPLLDETVAIVPPNAPSPTGPMFRGLPISLDDPPGAQRPTTGDTVTPVDDALQQQGTIRRHAHHIVIYSVKY